VRRSFFRDNEYVLFAYFLYTSLLALILPVSRTVTVATLATNIVVIGGLAFLVYAYRLRNNGFLGGLRDWYMVPLVLLAYRQMGWFALPHTGTELENSWIVWDRMLLNDWGLKSAIEALGPVVPSVLEVSYSLVYAMVPLGLLSLYVLGARERSGAYLFQVMLGLFAAYALFPYFPSEPPWTVFPGTDVPEYNTLFRQFNAALLTRHGIHTSVFPSAHVSGAFSAAFALLRLVPERRWLGWVNLVLAVSIATATVYGRYHYAADATAGFAIGVFVALICLWRSRKDPVV